MNLPCMKLRSTAKSLEPKTHTHTHSKLSNCYQSDSPEWSTSFLGIGFFRKTFQSRENSLCDEIHALRILKVADDKECIKFKRDQAQDAKKMEKLNNIFFTLMAHGPEADISDVGGREQVDAQPFKKGRGTIQ